MKIADEINIIHESERLDVYYREDLHIIFKRIAKGSDEILGKDIGGAESFVKEISASAEALLQVLGMENDDSLTDWSKDELETILEATNDIFEAVRGIKGAFKSLGDKQKSSISDFVSSLTNDMKKLKKIYKRVNFLKDK